MDKTELFTPDAELQKAVADALAKIESGSYSERHPELGKMVNCQICGIRHRVNERKCEQIFTYRIGDYEYTREDKEGNIVPDYRTAIPLDEKPTKRQVMGAVAFKGKRIKPHLSSVKLQFVERTRAVFSRLGFPVEREKKQTIAEFTEQFNKNLQRARVVAAREIRKEREMSDRKYRRHQDQSRRINAGLL